MAEPRSDYAVTAIAFDLTAAEADALFERIADAAHALGQDVTVQSHVLEDERPSDG